MLEVKVFHLHDIFFLWSTSQPPIFCYRSGCQCLEVSPNVSHRVSLTQQAAIHWRYWWVDCGDDNDDDDCSYCKLWYNCCFCCHFVLSSTGNWLLKVRLIIWAMVIILFHVKWKHLTKLWQLSWIFTGIGSSVINWKYVKPILNIYKHSFLMLFANSVQEQ